jgi:hypothetical protein
MFIYFVCSLMFIPHLNQPKYGKLHQILICSTTRIANKLCMVKIRPGRPRLCIISALQLDLGTSRDHVQASQIRTVTLLLESSEYQAQTRRPCRPVAWRIVRSYFWHSIQSTKHQSNSRCTESLSSFLKRGSYRLSVIVVANQLRNMNSTLFICRIRNVDSTIN